MAPSFGELAYLYIGTNDFERDVRYYTQTVGAELIWAFNAFGAKVAGIRVGGGPLLLLADHRPAGTCMPIYAVDDLSASVATLQGCGNLLPDLRY